MPEGKENKTLRDMYNKKKKKKKKGMFSVITRTSQMKDVYKKRKDIMKELFKED